MNLKKCSLFFPLYVALALFVSCGSAKDIDYFQDTDNIPSYVYDNDSSHYETRIFPNDNLLITVSAINPQSVEMFNVVRLEGITYNISDYQGYLVDREGCINFPVIGKVDLSGRTKEEAVALLEHKISEYVENPVVNIRFMNYKITVLGDVARPGAYTIPNEQVTIPEAIAMAGDINITGVRKDILLCRVVSGQKEFHHIDLTSPDLFFSPYFYLQQNDILYVKPNKAKIGTSSSIYRDAPLIISAISLIIAVLTLLK